MTETVRKESGASLFSTIWSARHDPAARIHNVDLLAVLIAAPLPWPTTGVSIVAVLWAIAFAFPVERREFLASLMQPASALPIALVALALLGLLWSDAPPYERIHQLSQVSKLLVLPLLIYH